MKTPSILLLAVAAPLAFAQEGEAGHLHGPDGRHIVAPQSGGGAGSFILSHHDLKILDLSGKVVEGADVDSVITPKGSTTPIHTEKNAYEPENEVYGSHMTYTQPGEYVITENVKLPGGKSLSVEFPIWVPAGAGAADEHAHGPNWLLIGGAVVGGIALLFGVYQLGRRNAAAGAAAAVLILAGTITATQASAQEDDPSHMHGADGRHIVAPDQAGASGPKLKGYLSADLKESAEKTVEGYRFILSIENEEVSPDPGLVTLDEPSRKAIGLEVEEVQSLDSDTGLVVSGEVKPAASGEVALGARASGTVSAVHVSPGDPVRAGQLLVTLQSSEVAVAQGDYHRAAGEVRAASAALEDAQSRLAAAKIKASVAKENVARQKKLAQAGAFAVAPLEEAKGKLAEAEAEVKTAAARLESAEKHLARLEEGLKSGVTSRREVESARAERDQARAQLEAANLKAQIARSALEREQGIQSAGLRDSKEVRQAEADFAQAQAEERVAQSALASAKAQRARAEATLKAARDAVIALGGSPGGGSSIAVRTPVAGAVQTRAASVGMAVTPGQTLATVVNSRALWIEGHVFERDIPRVRPGQSAQVTVDALPDRSFEGTVAAVAPKIDEGTRAATVRVTVSGGDPHKSGLKAGMFARMRVGVGGGSGLAIPAAAVHEDAGQAQVFVVVDPGGVGKESAGTYRKTPVQLGRSFGSRVEVLSGLKPGQKVVTQGAYQLHLKAGEG